jgi:diaminobutyrate-2-oxoglutarate transaminase
LSFIAGTVALSYFADDELMTQTQRYGEQMATFLRGIRDKYPQHGFDVRGKGMMQAIDLMDGALAKRVQTLCFERGLLIGPCGVGGRVVKLIPPLTIEADNLERGLNILADAIDTAIGED